MKVKLFYIISLSFVILGFTSFDQLSEAIENYLKKANSYGEVEKLFEILGKKSKHYSTQLNSIPCYSPLNPNKTKRYSDQFGERFHPLDKVKKPHLGIDISAQYGTPVHSTANGKVLSISISDSGYGKKITISHDYGFQTVYAHLYTIIVKPGENIKIGDIIGFVGSTGKSTGSHLHYEIIKNGIHIDPYPFCFLTASIQKFL